MAYTINKFNGSILTTVLDGTIDRTTPIKLVGRDYAGYGEIQNENFVFLLENFADNTPPRNPLTGQLWFDTSQQKLKVYKNTEFRTLGTVEISATEPNNLSNGEFWWDSNTNQLYGYNGIGFDLIGPEKAGSGITRFTSRTIKNNSDVDESVIVGTINNDPVIIVSDSEFTISAVDFIDGFSNIKKGINLKNSSTGVTDPQGYWFWGTASNADRLDDLDSTQFLRSDEDTTLVGSLIFSDNNTGLEFSSSTVKDTATGLEISTAQGEIVFSESENDTVTFKIDTQDSETGLTYFGNQVWHEGNQGSGSGLDADTLDGLQAEDFLGANDKAVDSDKLDGLDSTDFLRATAKAVDSDLLDGIDSTGYLKTAGGTMSGNIVFEDNEEGIEWSRNTDGASIKFYSDSENSTDTRLEFQTQDNSNEYFLWTHQENGTSTELMRLVPNDNANGLSYRQNTVWHEGNHGTGSGLDADLLDGLQSTDFLPIDGKADTAGVADRSLNSDALNGLSSGVFLRKSGGTVTDFLTLHSNPIQDMHAATKTYVDTVVENEISQIEPLWAGATSFSNVAATYSSFPIGTKVSFWDERNYHRSANSNGGSVLISDRFRRTIEKVAANNWQDIGG